MKKQKDENVNIDKDEMSHINDEKRDDEKNGNAQQKKIQRKMDDDEV